MNKFDRIVGCGGFTADVIRSIQAGYLRHERWLE
jgi:hypothetical protein